jgi:cytochrome c oxidase cbb3-type subunit 3
MTAKRDEVLDHDYDGIREYGNPLPNWWLWLFYGTILFSVFYVPFYLLGLGPSSKEMYDAEQAEVETLRKAAPVAGGMVAPAPGATQAPAQDSLEGNAAAIEAGQAIFALNCIPCHGPQGQGVIGPNLADKYWLHGNTYADLLNTIANGVPEKGMIAWKTTLPPEKIRQVAAFVLSLQGSNPPNPKPPEGKLYP